MGKRADQRAYKHRLASATEVSRLARDIRGCKVITRALSTNKKDRELAEDFVKWHTYSEERSHLIGNEWQSHDLFGKGHNYLAYSGKLMNMPGRMNEYLLWRGLTSMGHLTARWSQSTLKSYWVTALRVVSLDIHVGDGG